MSVLAERAAAADARDVIADARDLAADARDLAAGVRDEAADVRDDVADIRDQAAAARDLTTSRLKAGGGSRGSGQAAATVFSLLCAVEEYGSDAEISAVWSALGAGPRSEQATERAQARQAGDAIADLAV